MYKIDTFSERHPFCVSGENNCGILTTSVQNVVFAVQWDGQTIKNNKNK